MKEVSFKLGLEASRAFGYTRPEAGASRRRRECSRRSRARTKWCIWKMAVIWASTGRRHEGLVALLGSLILIFRKLGRHERVLGKGVILAALWMVD